MRNSEPFLRALYWAEPMLPSLELILVAWVVLPWLDWRTVIVFHRTLRAAVLARMLRTLLFLSTLLPPPNAHKAAVDVGSIDFWPRHGGAANDLL